MVEKSCSIIKLFLITLSLVKKYYLYFLSLLHIPPYKIMSYRDSVNCSSREFKVCDSEYSLNYGVHRRQVYWISCNKRQQFKQKYLLKSLFVFIRPHPQTTTKNFCRLCTCTMKCVVIGIYTGRNYIPIVMPSLLKYYTHCVQYMWDYD